jgi:cob(I)alamin adenosyltransferase
MIHIYQGDGKGKTTAAIGLAVRNAGCGGKVIFAQFMKGGESGELNILKALDNVEVIRLEKHFPFYKNMTDEDKAEITKAHNELLENIENKSKDCTLIVLDEVTYPVSFGLIDKSKLNAFIKNTKCELVLTGRNPDEEWIEIADYVTEMKKVKHPFEKGITARKGIEY